MRIHTLLPLFLAALVAAMPPIEINPFDEESNSEISPIASDNRPSCPGGLEWTTESMDFPKNRNYIGTSLYLRYNLIINSGWP
jgi:hypothetical protein